MINLLKGTKEGVLIDIKNFESDLIELKLKLSKLDFFPKETTFVLKEENNRYFSKIFAELEKHGHYLIVVREKIVEKIIEKEKIVEKFIEKAEKVLIVEKTLRSGQIVEHDGDIVLLGSINPGGQIIASGDVYVFGRAKGIIHAGSKGDKTKRIIALSMEMSQIRIGDVVAKGESEKPADMVAEIAYLDKDGNLVIDEFKLIK